MGFENVGLNSEVKIVTRSLCQLLFYRLAARFSP